MSEHRTKWRKLWVYISHWYFFLDRKRPFSWRTRSFWNDSSWSDSYYYFCCSSTALTVSGRHHGSMCGQTIVLNRELRGHSVCKTIVDSTVQLPWCDFSFSALHGRIKLPKTVISGSLIKSWLEHFCLLEFSMNWKLKYMKQY